MTLDETRAAPQRWRLFVAAWPHDSLLDALAPIDRWLNQRRTHRIIPREQRYLTLAFLGDVEPPVVDELESAYRAALLASLPIKSNIEGVIGIPSARKARVVAVGFERRPDLISWMERVLMVTAEIAPVETVLRDLDRERSPHITLARTRHSEKARRLNLAEAPHIEGTMTIESVRIIRSHLTAQGPQYEVVRAIHPGAD